MTSTRPTSITDERPPLRGDEERLFVLHSNRLRAVVRGCVNTSDANIEDGCAFAWLQLIVMQPRRETVFRWLTKVAIRHALLLDKPCRSRETAFYDNRPGDQPLELEMRIVLCETLEQLSGIHERKRRMLLLHAAGLTHDEIAEEAGISTARARELVYQARLQLRRRMGLDGLDPRSRK